MLQPLENTQLRDVGIKLIISIRKTHNVQSKDYTSCFARLNLLRLLKSLKVEDKANFQSGPWF